MAEEKIEEQSTKGALAAIAAGVLVIIAGFLVYNYFSKVSKGPEVEFSQEEGEKELELGQEEEAGEAGTTEGEKGQKEVPTLGTGGAVNETTAWQATDYNKSDIKGDKYTVKWGDTLWEIAEARYGSGFEWAKILEANKGKIGILADGSQALIEPGQALKLP